MSLKLIGVDNEGGIQERFHHNEHTGETVIQRVQDVEDHLKFSKEMYNGHNRPNYSDSNGQHLVARIPIIVVEKWMEQGFNWFKATDNERRAWLDKEENAVFKVRPGKLGGKSKTRMTYKAS